MDDLRERIAYLQGLAEGLKLEEGKDEARIIKQMIDILADLIDKVEEVEASQEDLRITWRASTKTSTKMMKMMKTKTKMKKMTEDDLEMRTRMAAMMTITN